MPQPVQPPEIPAIIRPVSSNISANYNQCSQGMPPVSVKDCVSSSVCQQSTQATIDPAVLTIPKISLLEDSCLLNLGKSAALLGPPISVGYRVQPTSRAKPNLDSNRTWAQTTDKRQSQTKRQITTPKINKSSPTKRLSLNLRQSPISETALKRFFRIVPVANPKFARN